MNWAAAHGKISKAVVSEFNEASKGKKLPERVRKKSTGNPGVRGVAPARMA
jgi:hypothetical protein